MSCPKCRADTIKDACFCHLCGIMLKPYCPPCRIELPANSQFCYRCGLPQAHFTIPATAGAYVPAPTPVMVAAKPAAAGLQEIPEHLRSKFQSAQSAITSERKLVSIVFADVSGFTAMSEKLDPEKVTDIMNQCFRRLGKIVYEHEGYIDKFMGDCIMALFGAPIAHENDSELAVDCSLQILEELKAFNQEAGLQLGMSIGINSGMVIAGGVGTDKKFEYTVMGDAVNVAQRLQSAAKRGQILVSKNIHKVCDKKFDFETLPPINVKGKEAAVEVYGVTGRKQVELRDRGIQAGYTPLIGREREIQIIDRLLEELPQNRGQIFFMSGEPGIGKSRLKHEMKKKVMALQHKWLEARCTNLNRETPYFVFIDLLHHILEIDRKADLSTQRKQIGCLTDYGLDATSELVIRDLLNIQLPSDEPLQVDAAQKRQLTFLAVKNLFISLTKKNISTIYFEDLHWIDPLSRDLLDQIMDNVSKLPLLLTGGFRPDFVHNWAQKKNYTQISLSPLTVEQSLQLVRTLLNLEQVPHALSQLIESKTDGNPLYVEEIVKNLIDSTKITRTGDRWTVADDIQSVEIPATVQGIIASRIDRLNEADKQVLQYASVIGRRFSDTLLTKVISMSSDLYESLKNLRKKELIFEASSEHNEIVYMFNHALMQDVAYQGILTKTKRVYHQRVGDALEELLTAKDANKLEEFSETLSRHFVEAQMADKAVHYLRLSGKKMADSFSNQEAIRAFKQAIQILECNSADDATVDPRLTDLYIALSNVHLLIGEFDSAETIQQKLLEIGTKKNDSHQLAQCYRHMGEISRKRGLLDTALLQLHQSLEFAVKAEDFEGQIRASKSLANTWKDLNNLDKSIEIFEQGLAGAKTIGKTRLIAEYLNDMATVLLEKHELELANKCLEESISFSQQDPSLKSLLASSTNNLGCVLQYQSDNKGALAKFREAAKVATQIGDLKNSIIARNNIGEMLVEFGSYEEALAEYEDVYKITTDIGNNFGRVNARVPMGYVKTKLGQPTEGEKILKEMVEECASRKYWNFYCDAHIYLARFLIEAKRRPEAEISLQTALGKAKELNNQLLITRCEAEWKKLIDTPPTALSAHWIIAGNPNKGTRSLGALY